MNALIEQPDGAYILLDAGDPVCGEDFCDQCGDCLSCYSDDCFYADDGQHLWVIYEGTNKWRALMGRKDVE